MLDLRTLVQDPETVKASLTKRHQSSLHGLVDQVVELDRKRKAGIQEVEALKAKRNQAMEQHDYRHEGR